MADGQRGYQEELIGTRPKTHIQFTLVQRQELPLGGLTGLKDSRKEKRVESELKIEQSDKPNKIKYNFNTQQEELQHGRTFLAQNPHKRVGETLARTR